MNGPPATTPTPFTIEEWASWNCTVMKPPDEMPEMEVWLMSMFSAGSGGAAWAGRAAARTPRLARVASHGARNRRGLGVTRAGMGFSS